MTDQLGTPRMIFDQSGALANVSRHDYLPFGEDLFAGTGSRTQAQGYTLSDSVRQKFTSKERDSETGLDFSEARYLSGSQGRFISIDPLVSSCRAELPQTWNRYSYVLNNPLRFIDPSGMVEEDDQKPKRPARRDGDPLPPAKPDDGSPHGITAIVDSLKPEEPLIQTNETPIVTTIAQKPGESTPPPGHDFTTLEIGTGKIGFGVSFSATRDRSGNWYFGIKPNIGVTLFPVTASIVQGEVYQGGPYSLNSTRVTDPSSVRSAIEGFSFTGQLTLPTADTVSGSVNMQPIELAPLLMQGGALPSGVRTKESGYSINIPGSASVGFQRTFRIRGTGP